MATTTTDLLKKFDSLRSRYSARDLAYQSNWLAYCGRYEELYKNYSANPLSLNIQPREKTIQKWNMVAPIVNTYYLLVNQMPNIRVPAPVMGEALAALKADKEEKILYAWQSEIKMKRKHGEGAFNMALNTCTVWQLAWDDERELPSVLTRTPGETYPMMSRGGDEVSYCFFYSTVNAEELAEEYPAVKDMLTRSRRGQSSLGDIELIEYTDATERLFIIGGDVKSIIPRKTTEHKLKHCPVFIASGLDIPGILFPPTIVEQLVPMNDHLNRFQTKLGDAIEETLFGWHDVVGEGAKDAFINTGPGAINYLEGDLRHEYTQPQAPPSQAFGHADMVNRIMRQMAIFPDSASGEMDSSIITGKAVSRLQGVMSAQVTQYQGALKDSMQEVNSMALRMFETYRGDKRYQLYNTEPVILSQTGKKGSFGVDFIPNQDIQGFYVNELNYSPFGSDMTQGVALGMQLVDAKIWPRSYLRNLLPGSSDAEGMAAEIEEEDRRRMEMEIELQTAAQIKLAEAQGKIQQQTMQQQAQLQGGAAPQSLGGAGAESPTAAPQPQGGPAPQGNIPNTTLMPAGQPQMMGIGEPMTGDAESFPINYTPLKPYGPAMAELAGSGAHGAAVNEKVAGNIGGGLKASPNAVTLEEATQILSKVQKLKGSVYLTGDIVANGYTDASVEVALTNAIDKQTISNAIKGTKLDGRIRFTTNIPTNGAVQVAGKAV